jgi:hypothetical protein
MSLDHFSKEAPFKSHKNHLMLFGTLYQQLISWSKLMEINPLDIFASFKTPLTKISCFTVIDWLHSAIYSARFYFRSVYMLLQEICLPPFRYRFFRFEPCSIQIMHLSLHSSAAALQCLESVTHESKSTRPSCALIHSFVRYLATQN